MISKELTQIILAKGHHNITSTNQATFEITKETYLTRKGDCIIAVAADKSIEDLSSEFKQALRNSKARLLIKIEAGDACEIILAEGDTKLVLSHPTDMVVRKSDYISDRTLAIKAEKAARDLSPRLVDILKSPDQLIKITLTVKLTE